MASAFPDSFECLNCSQSLQQGSRLVLKCSHGFCASCLLQDVVEQLSNNNLTNEISGQDDKDRETISYLRCPFYPFCDGFVTSEVFQPVLGHELYNKVKNILPSRQMDRGSEIDRQICPRCSVPAGSVELDCFLGTCHPCGYVFCTNCKSDYHGFDCNLKLDLNSKIEQQNNKDFDFTELVIVLEQVLDENSKRRDAMSRSTKTLEKPNAEQPSIYNPVFECCICLNDDIILNQIVDFGCSHTNACKNCTKAYFENYIQNGQIFELKCPSPGCGRMASQGLIKELVDPQAFFKMEELQLNDALKGFPEIVHCPKPNCQMMIQAQPEYGFCPSCQYSFCTACFRPFHGASPCGLTDVEMQERMRKYVIADEAEKRRMDEEEKQARKVQDDESEKLIKNIYKKCPSCPTNIEKIEGCNKLVCTKCQTIFCWLCGKKISGVDPYQHFRDGECKLFEVPPEDDSD